IIGGYLMPDLSQNLVHLGWLLKLIDFRAAGELSWGSTVLATLYKEMWNHSASYVEIPTFLEDIRLLLDQRSETQFQWTPYENPTIRAVIPDEFLQNSNVWHVKVPLVNYATVEMHQSNRILRIHGKPYLLSEEERRQQIRAQWERRGPLNPKRRDDDIGPSTTPTQTPGPSIAPTQSPGPTIQSITPTS
ncbi:hypothetical protein J1N35_040308, partial [Gossypium stocksii]